MADANDIATSIASALTEVGVTGKLDVTSPDGRATSVIGELTGDDTKVTVVIEDLPADE